MRPDSSPKLLMSHMSQHLMLGLFTGRTSELRGKEKDPQQDRVGFKQEHKSKTGYIMFHRILRKEFRTHYRPTRMYQAG